MVLDCCSEDSGTGMRGVDACPLPDLIVGREGRRSGSVPGNQRCVEHICQWGQQWYQAQPYSFGLLQVSLTFQSAHNAAYEQLRALWHQPQVLPFCRVLICQRRVSQQLLINLQKEIPIRRSRKKPAHCNCSWCYVFCSCIPLISDHLFVLIMLRTSPQTCQIKVGRPRLWMSELITRHLTLFMSEDIVKNRTNIWVRSFH